MIAKAKLSSQPTPRWYPLRYHPEQARLWTARERFRVTGAGRRSGKTEIAKRFIVEQALTHHERSEFLDGFYAAAAPTHQQARDIFWDDLKALTPSKFVSAIRESDLTVRLVTGTTVRVAGMDKPQRIEGHPLDGIVLDEYSEMKPDAWTRHVRPALSTPGRPGWAWFIGIPRAAPHFKRLYDGAAALEDWEAFHWLSEDILDPEEIEAAKGELDPLTYAQEYEASWDTYQGRAYYPFDRRVHCKPLEYDPSKPLVFCFDFNVDPGVAAVVQEQDGITAIIGEVWVPRNSNTRIVCRRLVSDWGKHKGEVHIYGDATGGARGSAKVAGSDWDIVRAELRGEFDLRWNVQRRNPAERARVNAVNARLETADGEHHLVVDPETAAHVVDDFEGVCVIEGGSGELLKPTSGVGSELTHLTDALGYYIFKRHGVGGLQVATSEVFF